MSTGKSIWTRISQLANDLDGDRVSSEGTLDDLEADLRQIASSDRDEIRRQMIQIVAALSRLEVRMIEAHGPLRAIV